MKTKIIAVAGLALAIGSSLAHASGPKPAPAKQVQSNGIRQQNTNQYRDRTPKLHERGAIAPR